MVRFTEMERVEVWDRWQAGDANRLIGRDLGRSAASIQAFVESWGGIRPQPRTRSPRHLSLTEREEISRGVAAGVSLRMVAVRLGRAPSIRYCCSMRQTTCSVDRLMVPGMADDGAGCDHSQAHRNYARRRLCRIFTRLPDLCISLNEGRALTSFLKRPSIQGINVIR